MRALNEAPATDPEYPPELGAVVVLVAVGVGDTADFVGFGAGVALCVAAAFGFEVTCAFLVAAAFDGEAVDVVAAGSGADVVEAATGLD